MKRAITRWMAVLAVAALAGCAGTKFVRPAEADLQLGRTTEQEVVARMGKAVQEANAMNNGKSTKTLVYGYASFGGEPKNPGVTPVHALTLSFHEGKLVSKLYMSNLKEDATDFDATKVPQIQIGKTTAAQVQALLGPAPGAFVYPVAKNPAGRSMIYQYQEMRGFTASTKTLTVELDPQGIVADVNYLNQGTWGK